MPNQNPEQIARDKIDMLLKQSGWTVQEFKYMNLSVAKGIAVKEYRTEVGPADFVLFIDGDPIGIIEAKRKEEGSHLSAHEQQLELYIQSKLKYRERADTKFGYLSTGEITYFVDYRDPDPRSREIFSFHRPETLDEMLRMVRSLRDRLQDLPGLETQGLRECQINAIINLEDSLKNNKPKALIQMATGAGKTYTAITFIYRLLKFAKAKRVLFLVDTRNLGEQAEGEFLNYTPNDSNRKFPELYGVTRLKSSFIPPDNQVYISTIQRMYSILRGTELDESSEDNNPNETKWSNTPVPVSYNEKVPIEFFDFIVIDECHRSIYNGWKQVLDYFDVFQIGLTATPDNRTFGYFNQNVVSDYGYEKAVIDGVLVPYNVYTINTKITQQGAKIEIGENVDKRERITRKKFWETVDEEINYQGSQLDRDIVNPSQIRIIIRAFKEALPTMFPDRYDEHGNFEVPKTLIFAKTDSHAEDIIEIVRQEFNEENKFCRKITYRSEDDPKTILTQFRNDYSPRIAITVDMIATGTDIRPLEILLFMRDVRSRSYYEQMKGRGTRTCTLEELKLKGTPTAKYNKDHFVIIDAVGVENSQKTDSRPLEKHPGMSLKNLLENIGAGNKSEDILTSTANRLIRLDRQIDDKQRAKLELLSGGKTISQLVNQLLQTYDPDVLENIKTTVQNEYRGEAPIVIDRHIAERHKSMIEQSTKEFNNPDLRNYIIDVRRTLDQVIDTINLDEITTQGWQKDQKSEAENTISNFKSWIEAHRDEITALQIFYDQPYRRRELTFQMIKDLYEKIKLEQPLLAPSRVWNAYQLLENNNLSPKNELIALVSLIRKVSGIDQNLALYDKTVDRNFQQWILRQNAGQHNRFTEEQMQWLRMIRDYVANSFHIDREDFELDPFNRNGGLGRMWQLFGDKTEEIIGELNEVLAA